jgi:hypothetical protein
MSQRPSPVSALVRVFDYLSVGAVLLSLTIFFTGGFREWMPWGRVSITSWLRPLIIAAVVIAVRHWLQPRPTLVSRAVDAAVAISRTAEVRAVLPTFLSTRIGVLLVGLLAVGLFGFRAEAGPPWRLYENELLNLPARWDTGWYIGIAAEGYRWQPARMAVQQNIAFFPAYPMLMRYVSLFLAREVMWTGVLIAWAAFLAALIYLFRFARDRLGDDTAGAAIALLACYPFALFFSTAYTEPLFLLTLVGACYHFERSELWKAAGWGLVAGLTRPNGCLLSVVLALIAVRPYWPLASVERHWGALTARLAVASLPGVGMLIYSAFIYALTGHPFQWAAQNAAWGRVYRGLDTLFEEQVVMLNQDALYAFAATQAVDALQLAAVVFHLAAVWPVYRRLGLPYAAMILVNLVPPLMMGGLLSMGRVTSVLFPAFLWLAAILPVHHRTAWIIGFAMVQALCASLFFTWRPLF